MIERATRFVQTNGIQLQVTTAGPSGGEPVILLHGFPDASFGWDAQIEALARAGFFVIAPDQRGYNQSEKPSGVENYKVETLAQDILGLADAFGLAQFNLAGHDWGAIVSWTLADLYPQRVKKLAILNVPHPRVLRAFLKKNGRQRRKSWYMFFFQLPDLPEWILSANNYGQMARSISKALSAEQRQRYLEAWSQPGALTGMLNWYRAMFRGGKSGSGQLIKPPTLIIWGRNDAFLMWEMASESLERCENAQLETLEGASHWVHQDMPEEVNQLLINHFSSVP